MYFYVQTQDGRRKKIKAGKNDKVEDVRALVHDALSDFPPERQRLMHKGKQLENGSTLFHYNVNHDETVLLWPKATIPAASEELPPSPNPSHASQEEPGSDVTVQAEEYEPQETTEEEYCSHCENLTTTCYHCGCSVCGKKNSSESLLACDECGYYYHLWCLEPKLDAVPEGDWYCPECLNKNEDIVVAGEKIDISKTKKAKLPSATAKRKWGGGMATVGRRKECTSVPPHHFGKIPGVLCGSSWKHRIYCSEAGVHRPPVGGIAGSANNGGSPSIVLAGGYPGDEDLGIEFYYTGSGGRDLSGNKRTSKVQSFDQELTKANLALAVTCNAEVNPKKGAVAKNWRKSKPIRVVRSYKLRKFSDYAPAEGFRYDGIYKLVKFWPEKAQSGFIVWRYLLRRDDDEPAPWTSAGKAYIKEHNLVMYNPQDEGDENCDGPTKKKVKASKAYKPTKAILNMIKADERNQRAWEEALSRSFATEADFLEHISDQTAKCLVCFGLTSPPVTVPCCAQNYCEGCLRKSLAHDVHCAMCRTDLTNEDLPVNEELRAILRELFPYYEKPNNVSGSKSSAARKVIKGRGKVRAMR